MKLENYLKGIEPQSHNDTYAIGQGLESICN